MPAKSSQDKARVVCPHCGHQQMEPRAAISTNCRQCGQYLLVQELLHPKRKTAEKAPEHKRVNCFDCGTELDVPAVAQSAMCKRCSSYIDLQDYTINNAVSKNFKTKGRFVIEPKGYVFNTEVVAQEIVIKGRLIGKLAAERSLTIYSTAEIKGTFRTPLLFIPAGNFFHWKEPLRGNSLDISGELVSDVHAEATVILRATGRLFGNVRARHLIVEEGAVLVGQANIGESADATAAERAPAQR
jgi:cytoskeletal protein CcmA (bactofilin family)/DNA-directed RNA polymerase subunit RPC12/RpoP